MNDVMQRACLRVVVALLALAGLVPVAAQAPDAASAVPEAAGAVLWQFDTGG